MLPGAHYSDPEFSWKFEVSPGGIGFINGHGLGAQNDGDLIVGGARDFLLGGHLFKLRLIGGRKRAKQAVGVADALEPRAARLGRMA